MGTAQAVTGAGTPEEALAALRADAQTRARLQMRLWELDAELAQACLADRQNARARDIEIHRMVGRNLRADVLAFTAIGGLVSLTIMLLFVPIEDEPARDVLLLLSGALVAIVKEVFSFEFGSSRGSKEKQDALVAIKR